MTLYSIVYHDIEKYIRVYAERNNLWRRKKSNQMQNVHRATRLARLLEESDYTGCAVFSYNLF